MKKELTVTTNIEELILPKVVWNEKELLDKVYDVMDLYNTYKVKEGNEFVSKCADGFDVEWTDKKEDALEFNSYAYALGFADCEIVIVPKKLDVKDLAVGKKELAKIRNLSKDINKHKISVKKDYVTELNSFEDGVKEIMAFIKTCETGIAEQITSFETKQKEEKKKAICELVEWEAVHEYMPFNDNWLLKKYDVETVRLELETLAKELASQFNTIKMMATSHNIESAKYIEKLKSTPLDEVLQRIVEDANLTKEVKQEVVIIVEPIVVKEDEPIQSITRKLTGTLTQLTMLNDYAKKIGVEWQKQVNGVWV